MNEVRETIKFISALNESDFHPISSIFETIYSDISREHIITFLNIKIVIIYMSDKNYYRLEISTKNHQEDKIIYFNILQDVKNYCIDYLFTKL